MSHALLNTKIANSPHLEIYYHWFITGKSNRECQKLAKQLFNETISYEAFRRYRIQMSEAELSSDYKKISLDIDEKQHLTALIVMMERRIVDLMKVEEQLGGFQLIRTDKLMAELSLMLVKLSEMKIKRLKLIDYHLKKSSQDVKNETFDEFRQRILNILARFA